MEPKLSELLQNLIDNPDDLSILASAKETAVSYENSEVDYQTRIDKLQSANRNLLQMVPQPQEEPPQPNVEDDITNDTPTLTDAVEAMQNILGGK